MYPCIRIKGWVRMIQLRPRLRIVDEAGSGPGQERDPRVPWPDGFTDPDPARWRRCRGRRPAGTPARGPAGRRRPGHAARPGLAADLAAYRRSGRADDPAPRRQPLAVRAAAGGRAAVVAVP